MGNGNSGMEALIPISEVVRMPHLVGAESLSRDLYVLLDGAGRPSRPSDAELSGVHGGAYPALT